MKVEIPEFKRCCCCLPLRYGLLVTAYVKMGLMILLSIPITYSLIAYCYLYPQERGEMWIPILISSIFLFFIFMDTVFTIVFLVGGHKKNVKLINIFYIYNIAVLCVFTFIFVTATLFELYGFGERHYFDTYIIIWAEGKIVGIANIGCDLYFILLIKSEIKKLSNNCQFRFENTAAEAQCSMEVEKLEIDVFETNKDGTDE